MPPSQRQWGRRAYDGHAADLALRRLLRRTAADALPGAAAEGKAEAALAASLFHYKELEIMNLKKYLSDKGISMRMI